MTTPEQQPRGETMRDAQRLLARARPEQLRRLLADIRAAEPLRDSEDRPARPRRAS